MRIKVDWDIPDELRNELLLHLNEFESAHPGCRLEVFVQSTPPVSMSAILREPTSSVAQILGRHGPSGLQPNGSAGAGGAAASDGASGGPRPQSWTTWTREASAVTAPAEITIRQTEVPRRELVIVTARSSDPHLPYPDLKSTTAASWRPIGAAAANVVATIISGSTAEATP